MSKRTQLYAALDKLTGASRRQAQAALEVAEASEEIMAILAEDMPAGPKAKPVKVRSDEPSSNAERAFWDFHAKYPGTKRAPRTEVELLKTKHKDWELVVASFPDRLQRYMDWRKRAQQMGEFVPEFKHMQTWINARGWEEWDALPAYKKVTMANVRPPAR